MFFWWLAAFLLLACVFVTGVLQPQALPRLIGDYPTRPINARPFFDQNSEILVENLIDARLAGSSATPGGFMFRIPGDPRTFDVRNPAAHQGSWRPTRQDLERRELYSSQLGLQGRVYSAAAAALGTGRSSAIAWLRSLTAAALAAMLATLVLLIRREWGRAAGLSSLLFCAVSTGFNLFAPSLYWISFAHVAPAAATSAALLLDARTRLHWAGVYLLLFLLFLIKFLSGFEFLTVTTAAAAMPFLLVYSKGGLSGALFLRRSALVLAAGIAAFLAAIAIHHFHHQNALGESGLDHLLSRSGRWAAGAEGGLIDQLLQFAKILMVNVADVDGFGIPSIVAFAAGVLFLVLGVRIMLRRNLEDPASAVVLSVAAAFLVSISWLVLQPEHVAFHPRYVTILLAYPFGIFLAAGGARLFACRAAGRLPASPARPVQAA